MNLLIDTADFPARWYCGHWTAAHGWTHIVADWLIFGAYFAIPLVLIYFIRTRRDVPFAPVFVLFALFILSCGIGHLVESFIFWWPAYRLSALLKVITAIASWGTVFALVYYLPQVLSLPGLKKVNLQLEAEIERRIASEREQQTNLKELADFHRFASGREERMIELKREVNELLRKLDQPERYDLQYHNPEQA